MHGLLICKQTRLRSSGGSGIVRRDATPQAPVGGDENEDARKTGCQLRNGCGSGNAGDSDETVQQEHDGDIHYALAQQGEDHRPGLLPDGLEDRDHCHADGLHWADDAQNPQKTVAVGHSLGVLYEKPGHRGGTEKQKQGSHYRHHHGVDEHRLYGAEHAPVIFGRIVIAYQGDDPLGHAYGHGKGEHVYLLCNAHARQGRIGIGGHQIVQDRV